MNIIPDTHNFTTYTVTDEFKHAREKMAKSKGFVVQ